jgi:DDE superfamily endonuclease
MRICTTRPNRCLRDIEGIYRGQYDSCGFLHMATPLHIVMDNYATHKTPKIKAWLARRPHYHVHFTPTSASWINQVERWFAELTRKRLQRGVHTSVRKLEADIRAFIDRHNQNPRPFKWTKSADQILASVKRFCHKAQQTLCGEL